MILDMRGLLERRWVVPRAVFEAVAIDVDGVVRSVALPRAVASAGRGREVLLLDG